MAKVSKTVEVCDRDAFGKEQPATTRRSYRIDDTDYEIALCEPHAVMFDREMMGWTRISREVDYVRPLRGLRSTYFTPDMVQREKGAAAVREQQARLDAEVAAEVRALRAPTPADIPLRREPEVSHAAKKWVLTPHAQQRMDERGYSLGEVLETAEYAQNSYAGNPKYGSASRVHQRGECAVVVDEQRKVIITVLHRTTEQYDPTQHRSQLREAVSS